MHTEPYPSDGRAADQDAAALLAAIIDSSDDAIIGEDLDGTITSWNGGAERLYGYSASEILGQNISLITPSDRKDEFAAVLARIGRGERVEPQETQHVSKDGAVLDISVTISPIRDSSATIIGASAIGRDITSRCSLERERELLENRLHQSDRLESMGQLAGGIAHDLNNLLGVILNYASFLNEELNDNAPATADLNQISVAAERACSLTRQLLTFSRREVLQPEVLNLNDVIAEIEARIRRTIGEHVELVTAMSGELWSVHADRASLEHVLESLATNARDAMLGGGLLAVDTQNVEVDEGYAAAHPGLALGRYVRLRVSDNGSGMERTVLERVFDPFFTTKPKGEGTGLGLSTVFGIVTQAGGEIQLYSEPGMGTTCRVLLPATDLEDSIASQIESRDLRGSETVLVVEDEDALREVTRRILARNGYKVLLSPNGPEALKLAADYDQEIDLLVTDVIMPYMLGKELADQLLQLRPRTRVLYMSGYAQPVLASQGTLDPNVALVDKPFSESLLLNKVRTILDVGMTRGKG